jgi:hypothetical protein
MKGLLETEGASNSSFETLEILLLKNTKPG